MFPAWRHAGMKDGTPGRQDDSITRLPVTYVHKITETVFHATIILLTFYQSVVNSQTEVCHTGFYGFYQWQTLNCHITAGM